VVSSSIILPTPAEAFVLGSRYQELVNRLIDVRINHSLIFETKEQVRLYVMDDFCRSVIEVCSFMLKEFSDISPLFTSRNEMFEVRTQLMSGNINAINVLDENELKKYNDVLIAYSVECYLSRFIKGLNLDRTVSNYSNFAEEYYRFRKHYNLTLLQIINYPDYNERYSHAYS
jgi:hypothetical protein